MILKTNVAYCDFWRLSQASYLCTRATSPFFLPVLAEVVSHREETTSTTDSS